MLVLSNERSLGEIQDTLEELEAGPAQRGHYSMLQRAFHTIKHEAKTLRLMKWAKAAEAAERIVENASERKLGLPLDLLRSAAAEFQNATEAVAKGVRHRLDAHLMEELLSTSSSRRN